MQDIRLCLHKTGSIHFIFFIFVLIKSVLSEQFECKSPFPFVFMHIPKNGGTTFSFYLQSNLDRVCKLQSISSLSQFTTETKTNKFNCSYSILFAGPEGDDRVTLASQTLKGKISISALIGHVPFHYCKFLPSSCKYITLLRDPVNRFFSHFFYLKRMHKDMLQGACTGCDDVDAFLIALSTGVKEHGEHDLLVGIDNLQTRFLSGDGFWSSLSGNQLCNKTMAGCDIAKPMKVNEAMLEKAKHNLRNHFLAFGFVEDMDAFQSELKDQFCFNSSGTKIDLENPLNRNGMNYSFVTPSTLALTHATQAFDIRLYHYAKLLQRQRQGLSI